MDGSTGDWYLSHIEKAKTAKGTNWEQKFQKPQNENICLTNLNLEKTAIFRCCHLEFSFTVNG
jgi:hypothetical protein